MPLAIGLGFRNEGSSNADIPHYRKMIQSLDQNGALPLAPIEWYHPGHYLACWSLHALQRSFGGSDDSSSSISLLNILIWAWVSFEIYRTWRRLMPRRDPWLAAWPALAIATIPGWAWAAQDAMSDVSGSGLMIIAGLRALALTPQRRGLVRGAMVAGLIAGVALTFRVSNLAFVPLTMVLLFRGTRRGGASLHRLQSRFVFAMALVLPWILLLLVLVSSHGFDQTVEVMSQQSGDNAWSGDRRVELARSFGAWGSAWGRGLGPINGVLALLTFSLLAYVAAFSTWVPDSLRRRRAGEPRRLVSQELFVWGIAALLLPHAALVLLNRTPSEFRYQLPVIAFFLLPLAWMGPWLEARTGRTLVRGIIVLNVVLNLSLLLPTLQELRLRRPFVRAGVEAALKVAPESSLFLAQIARPWLDLEPGQRTIIPVRAGGETKGARGPGSWHFARRAMDFARAQKASIIVINESGLDRFRLDLRRSGWRERTLKRLDRSGLRNFVDATWTSFDRDAIPCARDLEVIELLPPALEIRVSKKPGELRNAKIVGDKPLAGWHYEFEISAPGYLGYGYRLIFGQSLDTDDVQSATSAGLAYGALSLPFESGDPLVFESFAIGDQPEDRVLGLRGILPGAARAKAYISSRWEEPLKQSSIVLLLYRLEGLSGQEATLRHDLAIRVSRPVSLP